MLNVKKLKSLRNGMLKQYFRGFYMRMPRTNEVFDLLDKILITYKETL